MVVSFEATDGSKHVFQTEYLIACSFVKDNEGPVVNLLLDDSVRITQHVTQEESDSLYKILMGTKEGK